MRHYVDTTIWITTWSSLPEHTWEPIHIWMTSINQIAEHTEFLYIWRLGTIMHIEKQEWSYLSKLVIMKFGESF